MRHVKIIIELMIDVNIYKIYTTYLASKIFNYIYNYKINRYFYLKKY